MSSFIKPSSWKVGRKVRILHPAEGLGGKLGVIQRTQKNRVLVAVTLAKATAKKPEEIVVMAYYNPATELRLI
jgi:hypothetical protein